MVFEHNLLDLSVMSLLSLRPFYQDGWGEPEVLAETRKQFITPHETHDIDVKWINHSEDQLVEEGYFATPIDIPMPAVTRTAWFQRRLPKHDPDSPPPMVVLLAATGDEGYAYRTLFSRPLLRAGIGVIILENPFYGKRRPHGQVRSSIRSFADQLLMNFLTMEEARALLKWLSKSHPVVGVAGYSMGGFMSAYTAATYEEPIAVVPAAAGLSAGVTFTSSVMKTVPDWEALVLKDVNLEPQELFKRSLAPMDLNELPRPKDPDSAILIAGRDDSVVPPSQVEALFQYWQARELRWLDAGHSTGYMLHIRDVTRAIIDTVAIRAYKQQYEKQPHE